MHNYSEPTSQPSSAESVCLRPRPSQPGHPTHNMKPGSPRRQSPKKAVFTRSGARVSSLGHTTLGTFSTQGRPKLNFSPKRLVGQRDQVSVRDPFVGKAVDLPPPGTPTREPLSTAGPLVRTEPATIPQNEEDEWQDIPEEPVAQPAAEPTNEPQLLPKPYPEPQRKSAQDIRLPFSQQGSQNSLRSPGLDVSTHDGPSFYGLTPNGSRNRRGRWSWYSTSTSIRTTPPRRSRREREQKHTSSQSTFSALPWWRDPHMPVLLASYLQLGFNALMMSILLYGIAIFYTSVRGDVDMKVEEESMKIINAMAECSQHYLLNNCEPSKRVPALEVPCTQWEHCMNRDPRLVGRAQVSAETFGSIVESFLRPIGIKSMLFLICVFAGSFVLVNGVFASRIGPRFVAHAAEAGQNTAPASAPASSGMPSSPFKMRHQAQQLPPAPMRDFIPYTPGQGNGYNPSPLHTPLQSPYVVGYGSRMYSPRYYSSPHRYR